MQWDISQLKFMYNMERFATQIYLTQRNEFEEEWILNKLNAAAENEQEHINVLKKRIMELQGNQSHIGFVFQTAGRFLGTIAGIFGRSCVLKIDVFVKDRANMDYTALLNKVKFDENIVKLINQLIADKVFHKDNWTLSMEELAG